MEPAESMELLTAEEYADRFCIGRTTVFEWKKTGILIPGRHYIKIGRTLRFIWDSAIIKELHQSNPGKPVPNKKQAISSTVPKLISNKKSAINMEY